MSRTATAQDKAAKAQELREVLGELYDDQLAFIDAQLDDAILGIAARINQDPVLVYSASAMEGLCLATGIAFANGPSGPGEPIILAAIADLQAQATIEQPLRDLLADTVDRELLFIDPVEMDKAIVGVAHFKEQGPVVVYDREKLVAQFVEGDGMDQDEADEWVSFNVEGAYVGERTPIIMEKPAELFDS